MFKAVYLQTNPMVRLAVWLLDAIKRSFARLAHTLVGYPAQYSSLCQVAQPLVYFSNSRKFRKSFMTMRYNYFAVFRRTIKQL